MKKSLRNLAKVAAGLGAAYAISKIGKPDAIRGSEENPTFQGVRDFEKDDFLGSAKPPKIQRGSEENPTFQGRVRGTFGSETPQDIMPKSRRGIYGEPGSIEGFREANRQAALRRGRQFTESEGSPIALRKKRLGFEGGGSVVARGNKLARSKPTKLF